MMQDAMIWPAQLALWRSETETKQLELKQKNRSSEGQKVKKSGILAVRHTDETNVIG